MGRARAPWTVRRRGRSRCRRKGRSSRYRQCVTPICTMRERRGREVAPQGEVDAHPRESALRSRGLGFGPPLEAGNWGRMRRSAATFGRRFGQIGMCRRRVRELGCESRRRAADGLGAPVAWNVFEPRFFPPVVASGIDPACFDRVSLVWLTLRTMIPDASGQLALIGGGPTRP